MELRLLLKNTTYLIFSRIVQFFCGIIGSKLIAVFLGTIGAGILAQLQSISSQMASLSLMSINNGLVKQIAEQKSSDNFERKLTELLKSYIAIIIPVTLISLTLLFIFSKEITVYIFGEEKYYNYFLIGLVSLPILIINSISFAVLKGHKQIKYIARSEIIVSLINFTLFIPLIYFWGIKGAVISVPVSLVNYLIFNHYYAKTKILALYKISIKKIYSSGIKRDAIKELLTFAGVGIISGTVFMVSEISCRSIVVNKLGIDQLGIYKPVISWAALFIGFIMPSLTTYLYPRFSEARSNKEISGVLNDVLRLISFSMIPLLFLAIPIKYQIIPFFYSNEFISAGDYLPWHFLGTLIYLWMFSIRAVLTPSGRIKLHGSLIVINSLLDLSIVYLLVPVYGLYGYMLKFIVSPILFTPFLLIYLRKKINFSIEKKNVFIMLYTFLCTLLITVISYYNASHYLVNFFIGFILTLIAIAFLSYSERVYVLDKIVSGKNMMTRLFN